MVIVVYQEVTMLPLVVTLVVLMELVTAFILVIMLVLEKKIAISYIYQAAEQTLLAVINLTAAINQIF